MQNVKVVLKRSDRWILTLSFYICNYSQSDIYPHALAIVNPPIIAFMCMVLSRLSV